MRFAWKAQYFGALPHARAVDDKHVYWTVRYHGNIGRAKLDGTRVNPRFIRAGHLDGLAVGPGRG